MDDSTPSIAPRRGRPRKFSGPSRPVTLTLPVATIEALAAVDSDLSRAIVRVVQAKVRGAMRPPSSRPSAAAR